MIKRKVLAALACVASSGLMFTVSVSAQTKDRDHSLKKLDVNKDGALSREEVAGAPRLSKRFDQLDTNKDGKLTPDELRVDDNNDRKISREEAAKNPGLAKNFDAIDTNKDGTLSRDELAAWRKSHPHERGTRAPQQKP